MVGCMTCEYHSVVASGLVRCNHPRVAPIREKLRALASDPDQYIPATRPFVFLSKGEWRQHILRGEGHWPDRYAPEWVKECKLVAGEHGGTVRRVGDRWEVALSISGDIVPEWTVYAQCDGTACVDKSIEATMKQATQRGVEALARAVGHVACKVAILIESRLRNVERSWETLKEFLQESKTAYLDAAKKFGVNDPSTPDWMNLRLPDTPTSDAFEALKACSAIPQLKTDTCDRSHLADYRQGPIRQRVD